MGCPFRKKPRKFSEAQGTAMEQWRRDHVQSPWSTRYFTAPLRPSSVAFDSFRQKFRGPYPMFSYKLVREARASKFFPDELIRKRSRAATPLQLQIAAALRFLATGCPIDCNKEAARLRRSTMQGFNPDLFEWFNTRFYDEWITSTHAHEDAGLERLMKPFRMCGLPGVVCSRDGVHIATNRAKLQQRYFMIGKEGYPTWAYDCSVSHNRQFF